MLIVPALLLVGLLVAALADLFWLSLHGYDPFLGRVTGLTPGNYLEVLGNSTNIKVLLRTLLFSGIVTVISVAIALPMCYVLVRTRSRLLRVVILVTLLVPMFTGDIVRAFGWMVLLGRGGPLSWVFAGVGIEEFSLFATSTGVIVGMVQLMMPLSAFLIIPAVRAIDPELEQAALTLGAPPSKTWLNVILPLLTPGVVGASAVSFALSMTEFGVPALLGGGHHDLIANTVEYAFFDLNNISTGSALGVVTLVITAIGVAIIFAVGGSVAKRVGAVEPSDD